MTQKNIVSRRDLLKRATEVSGAVAVGVLAFPLGLEVIEAIGPNSQRITRSYARLQVANLANLTQGQPLDFSYPLQEHDSFIVKLAAPANYGVGPDKDIVAFSYLCSHMGCPLSGKYRHDHNIIGPCPCHFSTFDLTKNGILVLGQATQSLPQVVLEVEGDAIYATGVTGLVYGYRDNLDGGTPVAG